MKRAVNILFCAALATAPAAAFAQTTAANLTGSYRLDKTRSDNPNAAAERAVRNLPADTRQAVLNLITQRLRAPESLSIEMSGQAVTIASSLAPQLTFDADDVERSGQLADGSRLTVRAVKTANGLNIETESPSNTDFDLQIESVDNNSGIVVTRSISDARMPDAVTATSFYSKIADAPNWNLTANNADNAAQINVAASSNRARFIVPNGTILTAKLDNNLASSIAQTGDKISLRVTEPARFAGATISGTIARVQNSGRASGRSEMTFDFDQIKLANGQSYRFAGLLASVDSPNGALKVDNEGAIEESSSQAVKTERRGAIGAGLGAVFGALAGGGKGAAIGAVLGGGAGAGSVLAKGNQDLVLREGTVVTVRAAAPVSNY